MPLPTRSQQLGMLIVVGVIALYVLLQINCGSEL